MGRLAWYLPSALVACLALAPVAVLVALAAGAETVAGARSLEIMANTLALTGLTVAGTLLLGVPLALVTAYGDLAGRRAWVAALAAPLAVPSYIGAFAYFAAFGPGGELHSLLGVETPPIRGLLGTALVMTLYTFPFVLLTTRAALRSLDANVLDAARTLGVPLPEALLHIVLPRARNGIAAGALLVALYTLSDFGTPAILQLDTFTRMIYVEYNAFGLDRAALLALQLLVLVVAVLALESRIRVQRERPGRTLTLHLGRGPRIAAWTLMGLVLLAALAVPLGLFSLWLLREGAGSFDAALVWNSAGPSLLAALLAMVVALPVAQAAGLGPPGRLLERITHLGFGIPGIVMGTALVYVGLQLGFLYQTLALLVLGYVLRFLPLAVGSARSSLERLEGSLADAARCLGASPGEAFRRVTLPLALPGILAGGALVFLESMRELPATLLLRPTGLETLTTELWRVYEAGYFGRAAVPGLLLVLISALAVAVLLAGERRLEGGHG